MGHLIPSQAPIYLGLYVHTFVSFSESEEVEKHCECEIGKKISIDCNGQFSYFLGINFTVNKSISGDVSITLTQTVFIENLIKQANLGQYVTKPKILYRLGYPVNTILKSTLPEDRQ